MKCLVTGASGFLGGHVAEALVARGDSVRTIVRPTSDTALLESLGVERVVGDLADPAAIAEGLRGVDAVIHCAAKVGEWGPKEEYRRANVTDFEILLKAASEMRLARFVLVSSLGVYEARDHHGTDETAPLPDAHIDGYTQSKVEAEKLAQKYYRERGLPLAVVRPGFIYGPRDRTVMPRILRNLRKRLVTYFDSKNKVLNNVYVGNVVQAVLLALDKPCAIGQAYNVTDPVSVAKDTFFNTIADLAGLPRPRFTYPMWFARFLCASFETVGRVFGFAPLLNGARLKFMGLNLDYSIEKAKRELGYNPSVAFEDGMRTTIDWMRREGKLPS